ncbi:hypothetical protein ABIA39_007108 [Nocardia sp. GAS34]
MNGQEQVWTAGVNVVQGSDIDGGYVDVRR